MPPHMNVSLHRRARKRGVTLFEVLIVVAILALVAGGVGIAALQYYERARIRMSETNARAVQGGVETWWIDNDSGACPSVSDLLENGSMKHGSPTRDAWGGDWQIRCSGKDVSVASAGPDRKLGTEDDIRVPRP
jgi:general secretion pathway protein G